MKRPVIVIAIIICMFLIAGYGLYFFPKNYDILEIDAKNDNYSATGLLIGSISLSAALIAWGVFAKERGHVYFIIQVVLSTMLLFLWKRY